VGTLSLKDNLEEGLQVRRRERKKIVSSVRVPLPVPTRPHQHWFMDFLMDVLSGSRPVPAGHALLSRKYVVEAIGFVTKPPPAPVRDYPEEALCFLNVLRGAVNTD